MSKRYGQLCIPLLDPQCVHPALRGRTRDQAMGCLSKYNHLILLGSLAVGDEKHCFATPVCSQVH